MLTRPIRRSRRPGYQQALRNASGIRSGTGWYPPADMRRLDLRNVVTAVMLPQAIRQRRNDGYTRTMLVTAASLTADQEGCAHQAPLD